MKRLEIIAIVMLVLVVCLAPSALAAIDAGPSCDTPTHTIITWVASYIVGDKDLRESTYAPSFAQLLEGSYLFESEINILKPFEVKFVGEASPNEAVVYAKMAVTVKELALNPETTIVVLGDEYSKSRSTFVLTLIDGKWLISAAMLAEYVIGIK